VTAALQHLLAHFVRYGAGVLPLFVTFGIYGIGLVWAGRRGEAR
jgi:hypothetical protein